MMRSHYSYTVDAAGRFIAIIDLDTGMMSVTNDATNVISDLVAAGHKVDQYIILYRDSRGMWDRLVTRDERFAGFLPIRETDLETAKCKPLRPPPPEPRSNQPCRCGTVRMAMLSARRKGKDLKGRPRVNVNFEAPGNHYSFKMDEPSRIIALYELDKGHSVINDAQNIIADLVAAGYDVDKYIILYREGMWNRLMRQDGPYAGLPLCKSPDYETAKWMLLLY